jgi:hypothetical protein
MIWELIEMTMKNYQNWLEVFESEQSELSDEDMHLDEEQHDEVLSDVELLVVAKGEHKVFERVVEPSVQRESEFQ